MESGGEAFDLGVIRGAPWPAGIVVPRVPGDVPQLLEVGPERVWGLQAQPLNERRCLTVVGFSARAATSRSTSTLIEILGRN